MSDSDSAPEVDVGEIYEKAFNRVQKEDSSDDEEEVIPGIEGEFFRACQDGNKSKVQELLEQNPELVHIKDKDEYTPLHRASYNNHLEVLRVLIESGADINAKTLDSLTPLHSASNWNNWKCVGALVDHGCDVNCQTESGQTPLHLAAASSRQGPETLQILLSTARIDPYILNCEGETVQTVANRKGPFGHIVEYVNSQFRL